MSTSGLRLGAERWARGADREPRDGYILYTGRPVRGPMRAAGAPGVVWDLRARIDGPIVAVLYVVALWARGLILGSPVYGDEALHFFLARNWEQNPARVTDLFGFRWFDGNWLFLQRPAFYSLYSPAARLSFTAFRVFNILVTSMLPVLGYLLLRSYRVDRGFAGAGGALVALVPPLVVWGTIGLMDGAMATLFAAGLLAARSERYVAAAVLFMVSVWMKETALVAVLAWAALRAWRALRGPEVSLWPVRLNRELSAYAVALLVAPIPLVLALAQNLPMPGGARSGDFLYLLEDLHWSPWLLVLVGAGLAWNSSRQVALLALSQSGFYLVIHVVFGRAVEIWYTVLPVFLALVAAAAAAHALFRFLQVRAGRGIALGSVLMLLLGVLAGVAVSTETVERAVVHPFTPRADGSLPGAVAYETEVRHRGLVEAVARVRDASPPRLLLVDVRYPIALWYAHQGEWRIQGYSSEINEVLPSPPRALTQVLESNDTMTLVQVTEHPINQLVREVYAECVDPAAPEVVFIDGARCAGKGAEFERRFQEMLGI